MDSHDHRLALAVAILLALTLLPAAAVTDTTDRPLEPAAKTTSAAPAPAGPPPATPDLDAYRGRATWVDMYNSGPYKRPVDMVRRMADNGVRTVFLQTANYGRPENPNKPIYRPDVVSKIIETAHRHDIAVVAWYLPSFVDLDHDYERARAAIAFRTEHGQRFDGFALDIESPIVDDVTRRNRRLRVLTRRIEALVPESYALGAIVPEVGASYWRDFPYRFLARHYDVFLPMAYATFRTHGYDGTARFMNDNISEIRRRTGDEDIPIHLIGGIAGRSTSADVRAVVDVIVESGAIGGSLYDWPTTSAAAWRELQRVEPN